MRSQTSCRVTASLVAAAMALAACGSSGGDGGTASPENTVDKGVQSGVNDALNSTTTAAAAVTTAAAVATTVAAKPASIADWNALATKERAAVVKRITDNKWGLSADGKTITGPEGFSIDVSKCPAGWNNTQGITDTDIKIGNTISQSGTLAIYGQIAKGISTHLDVINAAGGIKGADGKSRKITYIAKDDGYDAARTIPLVDELVDSEKVFSVITLGSPNTMKTYDKLNVGCVPQVLSMTGHPAWGDPVKHPWTTGQQMAYNTEAVLWGAFIEKRAAELKGADGKITVAALVMNNDFGAAYNFGFKAWLSQSPLKDQVVYVNETIEPTAPTITDPMTTLTAKKPSVFIAMTAGTSCTQSITEAAQNGLKASAKYLFQPSVCKGASFVGKDKVGGDGSASDAWWVVGGGLKDAASPIYDADPWVQSARAELTAAGVDWKKDQTTLTGSIWGWSIEQVMSIASALPGGPTRANLIVALRAIDMTPPFLLEGAKFNMNGNKDAYLIEASEFAKYDFTKQGFIQVGDLIELSGKSSNCIWDQAKATCT